MTDLADWLAEQHAADERVARATTGGGTRWHAQAYVELRTLPQGHAGEPGVNPPYWRQIATGPNLDHLMPTEIEDHCRQDSRPDFAHIARHDPQATLARIEAERMLVAMHRPRVFQAFNGEDQELDPPHACEVCWDGFDEELHPCRTLRALAWGYRGRDGYRAEWAPEGVEVGA